MQKLEVRFRGWDQEWLVGTVADNGDVMLFEYSSEALSRGLEFSPISIPLGPWPYSGFGSHQFRLPGFIADALPDGWGLLLMERFFRKHFGKLPHNLTPIDRLAFIGDRAMGALSFSPPADLQLTMEDMHLIDLAREVQTVIADKETAALKQLVLVGGSPHGARPKALVQYDIISGDISTLPASPGAPWLVKFPAQGEHKEVCAIEYMYSALARECGMEMTATRYFDIDKKTSAFGIARFDREAGKRVPVHTLAGALNANFRIPSTNYDLLLRATRAMTNSEAEVVKAYERCVFNVVFNNRDDHAKNFSYRMDASMQWKLAPCYDLTYNTGPGGYHQMDVAGEALTPARKQLTDLARTSGVAHNTAMEILDRTVETASRIRTVVRDYELRPRTRTEVSNAVLANCARCIR
jgi:serine/threonine-protein kinase HipA